jgi:CheY-like chemotaxis protein
MAKIILVDDHKDSREIIRQLLQAKGHDVRSCESAEEAIGAIENEIPDAVITDQRLPGISGVELIQAVRSRWAGVRVVLTSADDSKREQGLAAGAWGFWLKGSDAFFNGIDELVAELDQSTR